MAGLSGYVPESKAERERREAQEAANRQQGQRDRQAKARQSEQR